MAYLKVKVPGGAIGLVSAYSPHNIKPLAQRVQFYTELDRAFRHCSVNNGKFIFGDFNARIGKARNREEHVFGPHGFGRETVHEVERPNRDLLLELCGGAGLLVANTL